MSRLVIPGDSIAGSLVRPDRTWCHSCVVSNLRGRGGIHIANLFGTGSLNRVLSNSY